MATIRWGIVGCGDVTEVKSGPGFRKARNSELVAVMRRDGEKARDYAHRHGVPKWYDDAEALIADPDVDAVYVATPPFAHRDPVVLCAAAGKPVLVEKPIARSADEAREIIDACESAGVPLFVAYYRRALPLFLKVKEIVDGGTIGTPLSVAITHDERPPAPGFDENGTPWRFLPEVGGGGVFVDIGCHAFDYLDLLLGPIVEAEGFATNRLGLYPAEDMVAGAFTFESGVHGVGTWCLGAHRNHEETRIVGTAGAVTFSFFSPSPIRVETAAETKDYDIGYPEHVHQPLIQTVVDDLLGTGTCTSTGETGLRASIVIDRMLRTYREKV